MQPFKLIFVAVLVLVSTTCQPPMQRSPAPVPTVTQIAPASVRPEPAHKQRFAQAPARVGQPITLGPKDFNSFTEGGVIFEHAVPSTGWWMFCLEGTKPRGVRFSFHAVIRCREPLPCNGSEFWQVDHLAVITEDETTVDACLQMDQTEDQLPAGQVVGIRSRFDVVGHMKLSAIFRRVDYP